MGQVEKRISWLDVVHAGFGEWSWSQDPHSESRQLLLWCMNCIKELGGSGISVLEASWETCQQSLPERLFLTQFFDSDMPSNCCSVTLFSFLHQLGWQYYHNNMPLPNETNIQRLFHVLWQIIGYHCFLFLQWQDTGSDFRISSPREVSCKH